MYVSISERMQFVKIPVNWAVIISNLKKACASTYVYIDNLYFILFVKLN